MVRSEFLDMRRTHCATKPSLEPLKMKLSLRALGNILWMTRACISDGIWSSTTLSLLRSSDVEYLGAGGFAFRVYALGLSFVDRGVS